MWGSFTKQESYHLCFSVCMYSGGSRYQPGNASGEGGGGNFGSGGRADPFTGKLLPVNNRSVVVTVLVNRVR